MKLGIIIPCYNRPQYLKECLWSLKNADLSQVSEVLFIDDNSTVQQTLIMLKEFQLDIKVSHYKNFANQKISACLLTGYNYFFIEHNFDMVINFDSDAVIRPDCINELLRLYQPGKLLTGFHSTTKALNGDERHIIKSVHDGYVMKESVGGINFCIDREAYLNHVKPALESTVNGGNWDHIASVSAGGVMCAVPSLIQHIGFESSLGHHENPDVADDFYYYDLPTVTLYGVDSNKERLNSAKDKCTKWIKFGDIVTLNPDIRSKEAYSEFIIKECYKSINTSHVLIYQHDGFVHNWKSWDNDWLQYDYIGAPWWYEDGYNVGNGGFSLRSKRLMEIVANDEYINSRGLYHPEDDVICRTYRKYLEDKYQIKFAPLSIAEKFAFEGYKQPTKVLADQFGVHGLNPRSVAVSQSRNERFVVNQFRGLGDILFLVPLIRALMFEGNTVLWPIVREYFDIAKHFPDINFVVKEDYVLPYESSAMNNTEHGRMLPYRFAMELMRRNLTQCMQSKYELYGHNWKMWRNLQFERFADKENELAELVGAKGQYILVNRFYGEAARGMQITPEITTDMPIVEMRTVPGYSLIDWCGIIENAAEIHTASTSILYILEMLKLSMPIHFYKRGLWGEIAFEHTELLYTKPYILH